MSVKKLVTEFMIESEYIRQEGDINSDTLLMDDGIIDSVGLVRLINLIEETYGVKVEDHEIVPENFNSLIAIENIIKQKNI
jgi:acyl carrier protein